MLKTSKINFSLDWNVQKLTQIFGRSSCSIESFLSRSVDETEEIGRAYAEVWHSRQKEDMSCRRLGLVGQKKSGKSTITDALANAFCDLEVFERGDNRQFEGESYILGGVSRVDVGDALKSLPERFADLSSDLAKPILKAAFDVCDTTSGLVIIEHAHLGKGRYNGLMFMTVLPDDDRLINVVTEKTLVKTEGYQDFLRESQSFRYS